MDKHQQIYLLFKEIAKAKHLEKKFMKGYDVEQAYFYEAQVKAFEKAISLLGASAALYNKASLLQVGDKIKGTEKAEHIKEGNVYTVKAFEFGYPLVEENGHETIVGNEEYEILFECNYREFDPFKNHKTGYGWNQNRCNFEDYVQPGNIVDDEIIEHFEGVVPPTTSKPGFIQCGEPYDHINGRPTYVTFVAENGVWYYRGHCFEGETKPM